MFEKELAKIKAERSKKKPQKKKKQKKSREPPKPKEIVTKKKKDRSKTQKKREERIAKRKEIEEIKKEKEIEPISALEPEEEEKIFVEDETDELDEAAAVQKITTKEPLSETIEGSEEQEEQEEITDMVIPQDSETKKEAPDVPPIEPSEEVAEKREKDEEITQVDEKLIKTPKKPTEEIKEKSTEELKEKIIRIPERRRKRKRKEIPETKMEEREVLRRHKMVLQENKNLTIKEFVEKLKLAPNDPSYLKSISPEDAVHILVIIGLHSFPFGPVLRRSVMEKIGKDPREITFQKLLDSITAINVDEIKDKKLLTVIRNVYNKINLRTIADPYQSDLQLKNHPVFQKFIKKSRHIKIAKLIGVPEEGLRRLSDKIPEEKTFIGSENEQIRDEVQINLELIQEIKETMSIMKRLEVKPKLAVILSKKFKQDDLTSLSVEEIKAAIEKSPIKVQESEYPNEKLKKIQTLLEIQNPNIAYLYKVIAELDLQSALKMYISEYKIKSIADFNKIVVENNEKKTIFDIISAKVDSKQKVEDLKVYLRLSRISKNFELNKALIENNFTSYYKITQIPLFEFQNKFINKASKNELKEIYYRIQRNFAKSVTRRSLRTLSPQNRQFDYLVNKLTSKKK